MFKKSLVGIIALGMVLVISLGAFDSNILAQEDDEKVINIGDYGSKNNSFTRDCYFLKDTLGAGHVNASYIPNVGWLISVEEAGQFNFDKMTTAIQDLSRFSLGLETGVVKRETKIFVSFEVLGEADYILVFNAEDLNNVENWKIYKGDKEQCNCPLGG